MGGGAGWEEELGGNKGWAVEGAEWEEDFNGKRGCVGGEAWRSERLGGRMKLDEKRVFVGEAVPEEIKQPPPLEGLTLYT